MHIDINENYVIDWEESLNKYFIRCFSYRF